jgi:DinB superfamily
MILQLNATRKEILTAIEGIPEHLFNAKSSEHTWSVGQVLEHLHKTEIEITRAITYMLSLPQQEPLADIPLAITLDRSKKITAPSTITPSSHALNKRDILESLCKSRIHLLQLIDTIPSELDLTRIGFKHPVFNEISLKQWIEFIGYHEKRHLAQIEEIKDAVTNESV